MKALRFAGVVAAAIVLLVVWVVFPRGVSSSEELLVRKGELSRVNVLNRTLIQGMTTEELVLESTSGLEVRALVQHREGTEGRQPAVLLIGGMETGRKAILHVPKHGATIVWMAVDYVYRKPPAFPGPWSVLRALPEAKRGAHDTLSALSLALDYLESRADVDSSRTVLVGGSLGAFFAVVGGAIEPRFEGVACLYGGGDLVRIVEANLSWSSAWRRKATARFLNPWLAPVDPVRFVPRISPRPFLMVNGKADERIPQECVLDLYREARDPKGIVWLETPHRILGQAELMAQATQVVLDWMRAQGWLTAGDIRNEP